MLFLDRRENSYPSVHLSQLWRRHHQLQVKIHIGLFSTWFDSAFSRPETERLTKDSPALERLKEVLDPEDIQLLRSRVFGDSSRSPKSLNSDTDSVGPLAKNKTKKLPRTILSSEEFLELKLKSQSQQLSNSNARRNKLEQLLRGLL